MVRHLLLIVALILASTASRTDADRIHMTDGAVHEGVVVAELNSSIVLDTVIRGVRTKLTLDMYDVDRIERMPVPDGFFGEDAPPDTTTTPKPKRTKEKDQAEPDRSTPARRRNGMTDGSYGVIPIEGVFGEDISPVGVREALQIAKRRDIRHIVFDINSGGGKVWAADSIANIMAEFDADFTYHAHIRNAFSASIWIVFSCDTITMTPGSSVGAAVVYTNMDEGVQAVEAKFASAKIAQLRGRASVKGHPDVLIAPMMDMTAQLFVWHDEHGNPILSNDSPSGSPANLKHLDNASQVLTLTVTDAEDIGLAKLCTRGHEGLGDLLGIADWNHAPNVCERAVARRGKELRTLVDTVEKGLPKLNVLIERAVAEHPSNFELNYYRSTGALTPNSQRLWRTQTDRALIAWRNVFQAFKQLDSLASRFEKVGGIERFPRDELQEVGQRVDEEIQDLQNNRNRRTR